MEIDVRTLDERIVETAQQAIRGKNSKMVKNFAPVIEDKDSYWEVSFKLPSAYLGGTPVVEIEKETMKVLKIYHTQ